MTRFTLEQATDEAVHFLAASTSAISSSSSITTTLATAPVISDVQPPSNSVIVSTTLVVTAFAAFLLVFELCFPILPWSATRERWRERHAASKLAGADAAETLAPEAAATTSAPDDVPADAAPASRSPWYCKPATLAVILANMLCLGVADVYQGMPGTFLTGEAQKAGLGPSFVGLYFSIAYFMAIPGVLLLVPWVTQFMDLADVVRIATAAFALIAAPQGVANLLGSGTAFSAWLLSLRLLEGLPFSFIEICCRALVNQRFQLDELAVVASINLLLRTLQCGASAPLGGVLYEAAGFTLPYMVIGLLGLLIVPPLRCVFRQQKRQSARHIRHATPRATTLTSSHVMLHTIFLLLTRLNLVARRRRLAQARCGVAGLRAPPRSRARVHPLLLHRQLHPVLI